MSGEERSAPDPSIRDVNDRVDVPRALRENEAMLGRVADSVDVAFVLRGLDPPVFLYVSPGYRKIFGTTR